MPSLRPALLGGGALIACLSLAARPALAQETPSDTLLTVDHYLQFVTVGDPQLSPDGSQVVYTRRFVNTHEDRWESELWVVNVDGSHNRFFAEGGNARWSPDGTRIAYLAKGEPDGSQLFVRWVNLPGPATQITRVEHALGSIGWSPDGKWIGFAMFEPKPEEWKISMPAPPKGAKWTPPPRIVDRLHYRQDRRGYTEPGVERLYVVPADGGTPRAITSDDWSVGARFDALSGAVGWDWAPDGKTIVVDGYRGADADRNYQDANLYAVTVATGATMRLTPERGTWRGPHYAPDGRHVVFEGHPYRDATYTVSALYVMNADGSGIRPLTTSLDRGPGSVAWARDGGGVYFTAQDGGAQNVFFTTLAGAVRPVTTGPQMLSGLAAGANGMLVAVRSTFTEPTNLVRFTARRPAAMTALTHVDEALLARMHLAHAEEVWYPSTGGARIQAWIVKPTGFEPGKKYPLILEIHGGPQAMYGTGFSYMFQNFAADGYVVLFVNPRGSTGYGDAFTNAIEHAYPSVDYDDLMAGVDTVIGRGYVDTTAMYVSGCSGGGVLSSWVIGHTTRFAAAAVRCPVIDWISMAAETDVPLFTYSYFAKPFWEDPSHWLDESSVMYVGHITTPTLLMSGVLDMRTPTPQAEEFYSALKMRGVPVKLLRFNGEYHGTGSKPSNFMRTQLYMMSWFREWRKK